MADFTLNFGGCHPNRQPVAEHHRGVQTTRAQLFSVGRRIYERGWREIELSWSVATEGTVVSILDLHTRTYGGPLTMLYTPDNGQTAYEVRFTGPLIITQTGPVSWAVAVNAEQRIAQ